MTRPTPPATRPPAPDAELERMLSQLCDGTLSDEDRERLGRRISADPSARRTYLLYVDLHASLQVSGAGGAPARPHPAPVPLRPDAPQPSGPAPSEAPAPRLRLARFARRTVLVATGVAAAAAAVLIPTAALVLLQPAPVAVPPVTGPGTAGMSRPAAGLLEEIAGDVILQKPDGRTTDAASGVLVPRGDVVRTVSDDGFAAVGFRDGTRLEINGRAQVRLPGEDSRAVVLTAGAMRVSTPAGDGTMVVITPQAELHVSSGTTITVSAAGSDATEVETESGMVRVVRTSDGRSVEVPAGSVAFALSGESALAVRPHPVSLTKPLHRLDFAKVRDLAVSPDGRRVTAVSAERARFTSLDIATGREDYDPVSVADASDRVHVSPDGARVLVVGRDRRVRMFDAATGGELPAVDPGSSANWAWAMSAGGRVVVAGHSVSGPPDQIRHWCDGAARPALTIDAPTACIAVSPDGTRIAAGMDRGRKGTAGHRMALWSADDGRRIATATVQDSPLRVLRFSHDGGRVAGASDNGSVRLWDAATGAESVSWGAADGWTRPVRALAFSPDGELLAVGTTDGRVRVCRTADGCEAAVLDTGKRSVSALAFTPDGRMLVAGSSGGPITVWAIPEFPAP